MLFNSLFFLIFMAITVIVYFAVPQKFKWGILLIASLYFYLCWNPVHIVVLLAVTAISYITAILLHKQTEQNRKKKLIITAGIILSFSFLVLSKYFDFIMSTIYSVMDSLNITYTPTSFSFALPVGISFFTFKAVSYMVDVYRGKIYEKNFAKYLLYVSFFPQLAAGPIERSTNLIPQFEEEHKLNTKMVESGLCLMLVGYFKKMVVADNISVIVSKIFNSPETYSPVVLFAIACVYSIQIYCDFSGYSDIAIGCAKVFGFDTAKNFDNPYFSTSIVEFWRKWHISLSSWFRDYLYIPLGGNRKGVFRKNINLMIVFLVSGLWHGSSWNFVFWGFLHGMYQIIGNLTKTLRSKFVKAIKLDKHETIHKFISIVITFVLVTIAWIFFRAESIEQGFNYIKCMFTNASEGLSLRAIISQVKTIFNSKTTLISFFVALIPFIAFEFADYKKGFCAIMTNSKTVVKIIVYALITAFIVMFASTAVSDFIYVRF